MLGVRSSKWGRRLDRVLCRLTSLRLHNIQMLGTRVIPGAVRHFQDRSKGTVRLPVLPSDHFGLFLELVPISVHTL